MISRPEVILNLLRDEYDVDYVFRRIELIIILQSLPPFSTQVSLALKTLKGFILKVKTT